MEAGEDPGSHKWTEGVGDERSAVEDRGAEAEFLLGVPLGEQEQGAREEGGLRKGEDGGWSARDRGASCDSVTHLYKSEEEASEECADEVVGDARQNRDCSPFSSKERVSPPRSRTAFKHWFVLTDRHAERQPKRRAPSVLDDHVTRDLHEDVAAVCAKPKVCQLCARRVGGAPTGGGGALTRREYSGASHTGFPRVSSPPRNP